MILQSKIFKIRRSSFEHLENWLSEIKENGNKDIVIVLIGNKSDRESE